MKATEGSKKSVHTVIEQHTNQDAEIVCEEERGVMGYKPVCSDWQ